MTLYTCVLERLGQWKPWKHFFSALCVIGVFFVMSACVKVDHTYVLKRPDGTTSRIMPIYIDDRWSSSEKNDLKNAIGEWNFSLNGEMILDVVSDSYHVKEMRPSGDGYFLIKIDSHDPILRGGTHPIALAWTDGSRGSSGVGGQRIFFIYDRFDEHDLLPIARHELGHMLGAEHIEKNGLMSRIFDEKKYNCIDADAVAAVVRFRHLSGIGMKWCVSH